MDQKTIAKTLNAIATLLELRGDNPFKIRAYQTGARALENLEENLQTVIEQKRLAQIPGIGKALTDKIETLYHTGALPYYQTLKAGTPQGFIDLLSIPNLGPKKIKALHEALGITSISELKAACQQGRIAPLLGFGKKTQEKLLTGIAHHTAYRRRHLWWEAHQLAQTILNNLRMLDTITQAECAGSLRRGMETVGDLDFLAATKHPKPIMDWFCSQETVAEVNAHGTTKSSIRFANGMQADLRIVPPDIYPFALHHFTGSKEHNVKMRQRALQHGYSLSEWGLQPKAPKTQPSGPIPNEAALFHALGLAYIPPELREGQDEIDLAEQHELPKLIKANEIRGTFHNHTTASDGHDTLEAMAEAADTIGWEYLGIADHSQSSVQANGLSPERLRDQIKQIRTLNASKRYRVHLFAGCECDILPDGRLDYDEALLGELDYVVISVHSSLGQSETDMTARIHRALAHPCATILGHPTGRLLLRREPCAVNLPKVIAAAATHGVALELNANPKRLDLDWRQWPRAAAQGILCTINPDAHSKEGLSYYQAGVRIARKGRLTASQVLNTQPLAQIKTYLEQRRQKTKSLWVS